MYTVTRPKHNSLRYSTNGSQGRARFRKALSGELHDLAYCLAQYARYEADLQRDLASTDPKALLRCKSAVICWSPELPRQFPASPEVRQAYREHKQRTAKLLQGAGYTVKG